MKTKKIKRYIFGFIYFLVFSFFIETNVYAALDMTEWEIDIEKDIIDDYKIKADEANVSFMKDKDSVVGDIVEHIYEEGSTKSGFDVRPISDNDFLVYKDNLYEYWGKLLYSYSRATGYINGDKDMLNTPQTNVSGYGYNFFLTDTTVSKNFADPNFWSQKQIDEFDTHLRPLGENLQDIFTNSSTNPCKFTVYVHYTVDTGSPTSSTDNKFIFDCTLYDVNNNVLGSSNNILTVNTTTFNNNPNYYWGKLRTNLGTFVNNYRDTIISNSINTNIYGSPVAKNTHIINNIDDYFLPITSVNVSGFDTTTKSLTKTFSVKARTGTTSVQDMINNLNSTSSTTRGGSWTFAAYNDIAYINDSTTLSTMINAGATDTYVNARIQCLAYLIQEYNTYYAQKFIQAINSTSESIKIHLYNNSYLTKDEYTEKAREYRYETNRIIQYEGAKFDTNGIDEYTRLLGASGFYYKNNCLGKPYDENNSNDIQEIFNLLISVNNPYGYADREQTYINLINSSGALDNMWVQPRPFHIVFNDTSVNYTPFLTTSCIINNPLDRYEFWGMNVSNENDTIYYGEAYELEPDIKNKDGYIGEPNHPVKLNPNNNWGIYLFTRYKYVNYIYKIYYGYYGTNPEMITKNVTPNKNYYENMPTFHFPQIQDNYYGWFWKKTYSIREYSGGYYLTNDIISNQETLIRERIMQNVEADNDIHWLTLAEIIYPNEYNNYSSFDTRNNSISNFGKKGDLYRYENAVRAETIYYQVNVPFKVDDKGNRNGLDYSLSLGADKKDFDCENANILCECDDEVGGCSLNTDEISMSATVTN